MSRSRSLLGWSALGSPTLERGLDPFLTGCSQKVRRFAVRARPRGLSAGPPEPSLAGGLASTTGYDSGSCAPFPVARLVVTWYSRRLPRINQLLAVTAPLRGARPARTHPLKSPDRVLISPMGSQDRTKTFRGSQGALRAPEGAYCRLQGSLLWQLPDQAEGKQVPRDRWCPCR